MDERAVRDGSEREDGGSYSRKKGISIGWSGTIGWHATTIPCWWLCSAFPHPPLFLFPFPSFGFALLLLLTLSFVFPRSRLEGRKTCAFLETPLTVHIGVATVAGALSALPVLVIPLLLLLLLLLLPAGSLKLPYLLSIEDRLHLLTIQAYGQIFLPSLRALLSRSSTFAYVRFYDVHVILILVRGVRWEYSSLKIISLFGFPVF